ncbi:hypothetical protein T484DRAFT_1756183 [Baffinella frigidus]|nr:hypothetical protein T484DRAFT_1756183 [Cryptophyta sp. CCMP2293]
MEYGTGTVDKTEMESTTSSETGSAHTIEAGLEPGLLADSTTNTTVLPPKEHNKEHRAVLQMLFDGVHEQISDPHVLCQAVRPFAALAVERTPNSPLLNEVLAFIDKGIATETAVSGDSTTPAWACTTGEMNAIVHLLNSNQFLLEEEEKDTQTPLDVYSDNTPTDAFKTQKKASVSDDDAFMKELADLAM